MVEKVGPPLISDYDNKYDTKAHAKHSPASKRRNNSAASRNAGNPNAIEEVATFPNQNKPPRTHEEFIRQREAQIEAQDFLVKQATDGLHAPNPEAAQEASGVNIPLSGPQPYARPNAATNEGQGSLKIPSADTNDDRAVLKLYEGDKPPLLSRLPDATQRNIEDLAKRKGVTPEVINRKLWEKLKRIDDGVNINEEEDATNRPKKTNLNVAPKGDRVVKPKADTKRVPKRIKQDLSDALKAQTKEIKKTGKLPADRSPTKRKTGGFYPKRVSHVSPVLELIGRTEGTDKGQGYNETLSYGAYTGGKVKLVGMTLDQVDKLQTQMLRHPKNKWNSSAAGRYQIVRTTLRKLRKKLKLKGNEVYDEDMQDRLALVLMEGRGYSSWKAGKITDKRFVNALAREWASFPKWEGGGHYKGQNAAVSSSRVMLALKKTGKVVSKSKKA